MNNTTGLTLNQSALESSFSLSQTITGGFALVILIAITIFGRRQLNNVIRKFSDQIDGEYKHFIINYKQNHNF